MQTFAARNNARLVLLNRRDFPGSDPHTEAERTQLAAARATSGEEALSILESYMHDRACEVFDFLGAFVKQEQILQPERVLAVSSFARGHLPRCG